MVAVELPPPAVRLGAVAGSPVRDLLALTQRPEVISFAGGLPAAELFDVEGIAGAFERALSSAGVRGALQYSSTEGDPALREHVAARLTARGLPTNRDELIITTGSQQALTLLATTLLDPGAVVAVEEPTYLAALQSFGLAGARLVPVASDDEGVTPESLECVCSEYRPRVLYLVPTFANPTGRTMSTQRRADIASVVARHAIRVIEDDPYGELRYGGDPVPALSARPEAADRSLYLGSFSKIGAPGLRLGWLRVTGPLRRTIVIAKQAADLHTSTVDQAAAAEYFAHADLDAHLIRLRSEYGARRDALVSGLPRVLPVGSTWTKPDGGMFIWIRLGDGQDASRLLRIALNHDVAFVPGAPFFAGTPAPSTFRMSFTTTSPTVIAAGLDRLAAALAEACNQNRTTSQLEDSW